MKPTSLFVSFDSDLLGEGDAEDDREKGKRREGSFKRARFSDFYGRLLVGHVVMWGLALGCTYRQRNALCLGAFSQLRRVGQ